MTRIDFYTRVDTPAQFACRLTQTVYNKGERLLVWLESDQALGAFSAHLWSFDDVAFVPHCRSDAPEAEATPIWLTAEAPQGDHPAVLLNLSDGTPAEPARFARILEIVGNDEASLAMARERFKRYRECGFVIEHHDMSNR
ncbi:MAG: DNA polymerase III subunit chi [Paludibacterium sp.]|uniref:DNA polymerase III subunit chi n=1 Tax=Paludibacterium sp. TaxID=1917523 RepID=UPI0025D0AFB3|nr:DNA polymerase III subunit chi [Paludibacterium sp.]MBV8046339.1 DNA polymerase III subunit chi [Paludibacterium sp.]MBV8649545.1 DNA polymerase III subunit chi [Paludibacterium sp.]